MEISACNKHFWTSLSGLCLEPKRSCIRAVASYPIPAVLSGQCLRCNGQSFVCTCSRLKFTRSRLECTRFACDALKCQHATNWAGVL